MSSLAKIDLFDDLFDHLFTIPTSKDYDLKTTDSEYVVTVELPGFTKENLDIEVVDSTLSVRATEGSGLRKTASKSWRLPQDADAVTAELTDGVLTMKITRSGAQKVKVHIQ